MNIQCVYPQNVNYTIVWLQQYNHSTLKILLYLKKERDLPFTDSFPQIIPIFRVETCQSQEPKSNRVFLYSLQELLQHHHCISRSALPGNWSEELEPGIEPKLSSMGCEHLNFQKSYLFQHSALTKKVNNISQTTPQFSEQFFES